MPLYKYSKKYEDKTVQELEQLYVHACKEDNYPLVKDLLSNSQLKNNIEPKILQQTISVIEQNEIQHFVLYRHIVDLNNYLIEKATFSIEFLTNINESQHQTLVNKTIEHGDVKTLTYILTSPTLEHIWKNFEFNQKMLNRVIDFGHAEVLDFLLSSPNIKKNIDIHEDNDSLFKNACKYGHPGIVNYLLHEASIDNRPKLDISSYQDTLQSVSRDGHLEVVQLLIDSNICLNTDYNLRACLSIASKSNHPEIVKYLLTSPKCSFAFEHKEHQKTFHDACYFGNLNLCKFLLDSPKLKNHADVNGTIGEYDSYSYNNGVVAAIQGKQLETLRFLIFDMNATKPKSINKILNKKENQEIKNMFTIRDVGTQLEKELTTNESPSKKNKI